MKGWCIFTGNVWISFRSLGGEVWVSFIFQLFSDCLSWCVMHLPRLDHWIHGSLCVWPFKTYCVASSTAVGYVGHIYVIANLCLCCSDFHFLWCTCIWAFHFWFEYIHLTIIVVLGSMSYRIRIIHHSLPIYDICACVVWLLFHLYIYIFIFLFFFV